MARDYKHRANNHNRTKSKESTIPWWKWALAIVLIAMFATFLTFLSNSSPEIEQTKKNKETLLSKKEKIKQAKKLQEEQNEPIFDFYTILPETEIIIPAHEIDTRKREEQFGKGKPLKYLIQAGSFRGFPEADKLRANLALMGIESKIEKAIIGNVIWNRVVMGPYTRSSSVSTIQKKLRKNGIDSRVTEIKG